MTFDDVYPLLQQLVSRTEHIILGKTRAIQLSIACLLARGHLLIEDVPGVGKTTLAHSLAHLTGLDFNRIQFTSDLLPADVLGVSIYEPRNEHFRFHPGPIFSQVILADEINRATPKTQSALLEAMEEEQVSIEGQSRALPQPFLVIATQNPQEQIGTFPLPESQLDRFLLCLSLGYPDHAAERQLLAGQDRRQMLQEEEAVISPQTLVNMQELADNVTVSDALLDYVQSLIAFSRESGQYQHGLSPRAGLGLVQAAKAWALLQQRQHVLPEDVQAVLPSLVRHRLVSTHSHSQHHAELMALPIP